MIVGRGITTTSAMVEGITVLLFSPSHTQTGLRWLITKPPDAQGYLRPLSDFWVSCRYPHGNVKWPKSRDILRRQSFVKLLLAEAGKFSATADWAMGGSCSYQGKRR